LETAFRRLMIPSVTEVYPRNTWQFIRTLCFSVWHSHWNLIRSKSYTSQSTELTAMFIQNTHTHNHTNKQTNKQTCTSACTNVTYVHYYISLYVYTKQQG